MDKFERSLERSQLAHASLTRETGDREAIGRTVEEAGLWQRHALNLLLMREQNELSPAPWRQTRFRAGQELALLGDRSQVE